MLDKEEVIHNNLKIIEGRLRNVYNCAYDRVQRAETKKLHDEYERGRLEAITTDAHTYELAKKDAFERGYREALKAVSERADVTGKKPPEDPFVLMNTLSALSGLYHFADMPDVLKKFGDLLDRCHAMIQFYAGEHPGWDIGEPINVDLKDLEVNP